MAPVGQCCQGIIHTTIDASICRIRQHGGKKGSDNKARKDKGTWHILHYYSRGG